MDARAYGAWLRGAIAMALVGAFAAGCGALDDPGEGEGDGAAPRVSDAATHGGDDAGAVGSDDAVAPVADDAAMCGTPYDREGCPCVPGSQDRCFIGDPSLMDSSGCGWGTQSCQGTGEFGRWSACSPTAPACLPPTPMGHDAGAPPPDAGRGTVTGGSPDAGMGTVVGGGVDGGTDAAMGLPMHGGVCSDAIDVTPVRVGDSVTVMGTTCGGGDALDLRCNTAGTPERYYSFTLPAGSSRFSWNVSPGFVVALAASFQHCMPPAGTCTGNMGSKTASASSPYEDYLIIEQRGGGCGAFSITVHRDM